MIELGISIYWKLMIFLLAGAGVSGLVTLYWHRRIVNAQKTALSALDRKIEIQKPVLAPILNADQKANKKFKALKYLNWVLCILVGLGALLIVAEQEGSLSQMIGAVFVITSTVVWGGTQTWRNRHRRRIVKQFPHALEMLVRGAKVGQSLEATFVHMARELDTPLSRMFERLSARMAIGQSLEQSLVEIADEQDLSEFRFMANALIIQRKSGGQYSEILERLQFNIRERLSQQEEIRALTAEGRSAAVVVIVLTLAIIAFLGVVNPDHFQFLINDPAGQDLLFYCALSIGCGVFCIYQLLELMND